MNNLKMETNIKDRYGNALVTDVPKPTPAQTLEAWCLLNELVKLGYPHNFQHERKDISDYMYDISAIVDKALAIKRRGEEESK